MTECKHNWKYKENKKYGSYYGVCQKCGLKKESWEIASEEKIINLKHQCICKENVIFDVIFDLRNALKIYDQTSDAYDLYQMVEDVINEYD